MEVHFPPTQQPVNSERVLFLAGPIQGAPDWQGAAIAYLTPRLEKYPVIIASPRRPNVIIGDTRPEFTERQYNEQVDWEHVYLNHANKWGVTLFWLAAEQEHHCDRAYAQTSRFELGEAMANEMARARARSTVSPGLAIGIEPGFTNERYIRRTFASKLPFIKIRDTLLDTCLDAVIALRGC